MLEFAVDGEGGEGGEGGEDGEGGEGAGAVGRASVKGTFYGVGGRQ